MDNTSNNDLSSKITVLQNNQYIKHIVVNGTISNNIITYDFSALKKTHGIFFFRISNSANGYYQALLISGWGVNQIADISQNNTGTISQSGFIENGTFKFIQNMGSTTVTYGRAEAYYIATY